MHWSSEMAGSPSLEVSQNQIHSIILKDLSKPQWFCDCLLLPVPCTHPFYRKMKQKLSGFSFWTKRRVLHKFNKSSCLTLLSSWHICYLLLHSVSLVSLLNKYFIIKKLRQRILSQNSSFIVRKYLFLFHYLVPHTWRLQIQALWYSEHFNFSLSSTKKFPKWFTLQNYYYSSLDS